MQFMSFLSNLIISKCTISAKTTFRACCKMATVDLKNFVKNGRKILGAGANYHSLLAVLKAPKPANPVIFMKSSTAYVVENNPIEIPKNFAVNEEVELGIIIGKKGKHINERDAMDFVGGYCVALDMTATCQMKEARSKGLPWTIGKSFDTACPVSRFISKEEIPDPHNVQLWCKVNGQARQDGNTNDLIFSVPNLISYISQFITLEPNDLILTGSPPGMGPVCPGDKVEAGIKDVASIEFSVKSAN